MKLPVSFQLPQRRPSRKKLEQELVEKDRLFQLAAHSIQAASNILSAADTDSSDKHYTGNPYSTYQRKVTQLHHMYAGTADWGCGTARTVIDVRAAFMIGSGVKAKLSDGYERPGTRELAYIKSFIRENGLDKNVPHRWSRISEIEGKFLAVLEQAIDNRHPDSRVSVVAKPYSVWPYVVEHDGSDLDHYIRARSGPGKSVPAGGITGGLAAARGFEAPEGRFVYARFGGEPGNINEPVSKVASAIQDMEDLQKCLWDWRKINHLYASPTPYFNFEETSSAAAFNDSAEYRNWRIGKGIILAGGTFKLVCYTGEGFTTLEEEYKAHARAISRDTGVPVQFFGFPDLLSNRDTADTLMDGIILATEEERKTWVEFYKQLFRDAIRLYNATNMNDYDPYAVDAEIPPITAAKVTEMKEIWLPLYEKGGISLETLLGMLSSVDADEEVVRVRRQAEEAVRRQQASGTPDNSNGTAGKTDRAGAMR